MEIQRLTDTDSHCVTQTLEKIFPVVQQLRPHLDFQSFLSLYKQAREQSGYELAFVEQDQKVVAAIGYRIITDFVHGRHLYIDDLVISEELRSKGLGTDLLGFAEEMALEWNCNQLRLCTGIENERGKSFYDKNGWKLRAVAFKKKL
jgi:GNAT superfamily N-acetyltransferase